MSVSHFDEGGSMLDRFEELADGLNHPEGVTWNPFDGLVYAGGEGGELYAVTLTGDVSLVGSSGGSMLGLAVDGRGLVYACDTADGEIARLDPANGEVTTYARGSGAATWTAPTWRRSAPRGRCM